MRHVCLLVVLALTAPAAARMPVRIPKLTLQPLTWDMNVEQAKAALDRAQMAPKDDEIRRYLVMDRAHPFVRHTTEPGWSFTPRKGWRGYVHFLWSTDANDYRMNRVVETAENLSPGALKDELAALDATYGTPTTTTKNQRTWVRAGTRLVASWSDSTLTVFLGLDR